jgi:hypothetical protein
VRGVALTADDIAAVRHQDIVRSLRTARRHLKTVELRDAQVAEAATQLRTRVKAAELESEYVEHLMLERWTEAQLAARPRGDSRDAVVANLQALLAAYGIGPERLIAAHAMKHLIAAALTRVVNE